MVPEKYHYNLIICISINIINTTALTLSLTKLIKKSHPFTIFHSVYTKTARYCTIVVRKNNKLSDSLK